MLLEAVEFWDSAELIFFESVDAWVPEAVMETPLDFL